MKLKTMLLPVLAAAGMIFAATASAGDAAAGQVKSSACVSCHGMNGQSSNPLYPVLAGQQEQYLLKAINAYRSGDRGDPTMKAMASTLTDADAENLAAFFSSQSCN
jgi:cytochrome c553